jgi:hypothetical protein
MNETSFAHILFATDVPGKPRPVGGSFIVSDFVLLISNLMVKGGGYEDLLYLVGDG